MGGFTHYEWKSGENQNVCDKDRRSFLFSLDNFEQYVPQAGKHLIYRIKEYRPLFGGGVPDLELDDQCDKGDNHGKFPTAYNRANGDKLQKNQETSQRFTGATINSYFKVPEYEVFKVTFK